MSCISEATQKEWDYARTSRARHWMEQCFQRKALERSLAPAHGSYMTHCSSGNTVCGYIAWMLFALTSTVTMRRVLPKFLIYMNNTCSGLSPSVCLFIDNCVSYRVIHKRDQCFALQFGLNNVEDWCSKLYMFAYKSTENSCMCLTRKHSAKHFRYTITVRKSLLSTSLNNLARFQLRNCHGTIMVLQGGVMG